MGRWPVKVVAAVMGASLVAAACSSDDGSTDAGTTANAAASTTVAETTPPAPPPTRAPVATPEPIPAEAPEGMELVWSDEFDGDEIDLTNWTYDIGGWGWGNGEAQYYTDRSENARVRNGLLVIELREEPFEDRFHTSARLRTQELREFQYGRIEARLKVPKGSGTWPAFWMLGSGFDQDAADPANQWPNVGEIDIMEYVGRDPDLVIGTVHGPGFSGAGGKSGWNRQEFEIGDDFHTYAVDWDPDGIRWFFNGEQYHEVAPADVPAGGWVFDRPFFIILNLALGGTLGGMIDPELEFPLHFYADYVRVYQPIDRADA